MNREVHMERGIDRSAVARRRGRPGQGIGGPAVARRRGRPRAAVCATDGRGYAGARTPASSPTAGAGARRIEPCAGRGAGSHSGVRRPLSYNPGGLASAAVGQGPPIISGDRQLQKGWELGDGREAPRHGASCLGHNGQSRAPSGVAAPPQRRRGSLHRNWRTLRLPGRRGGRGGFCPAPSVERAAVRGGRLHPRAPLSSCLPTDNTHLAAAVSPGHGAADTAPPRAQAAGPLPPFRGPAAAFETALKGVINPLQTPFILPGMPASRGNSEAPISSAESRGLAA